MNDVAVIIPALPSSIFSVIAGGALGFKSGYLTIVLADFICCQIAFFIARRYGRLPVKKIVGVKAMKRIESFNQNQLEAWKHEIFLFYREKNGDNGV